LGSGWGQSSGKDFTKVLQAVWCLVSPEVLRQAVTAETALVSIMLANNETGAINNIAALCSAAKAVNPRLLFHTDASQAVGKIKVDVVKLG